MKTILVAALAVFLFAGCANQLLPKDLDMQVHDCHVTITRSN
jgi:uncharacterized lipoprotein YajG